nr:MFS transporter [uncultured Holophaga sp.]
MRKVSVTQMIDQAKFTGFFKMIVAICLLTTIADGFDINIFGLIIPNLMKDWHLAPQNIGYLGSAGMFGMIFGSLAFGPLADSIGKKHSIIIGTLMYVIFTVACGFAHSLQSFAIYRFIAGFGLAGVFPLAVAFTSEFSPKANRSTLTVWVTSGMAVGTVVAALVGLAVISPANLASWRYMFYCSALVLIIVALQFALPESISYLKKKNQNAHIAKILQKIDPSFTPAADDEYELEAKAPTKGNVGNLFTGGYAKNTILFWFFMASSYIFIYGVLMWLPKLMTLKGYSVKGGLFFTMVWNLGFILGIPLFGKMADKIGGKRTIQIGWVCLAILVTILGFSNGYMALTVILFLTGACQHGVSGAAGSYLAQSYPTSFRATGTTWGYGLGRIGGTLGPIIGGYLLAKHWPVGYNLMFFAMFPLIAAIFASFTTDFFHKKAA